MTSQALEWFRKLDADTEFLAEEAKTAFAVSIERQLRQNGMSKADLARKLATSQAYVTKVLRGDANLTINTMVALAHAVDATLHLHVAERQTKVRWLEVVQGAITPSGAATDRQAATLWARHASQKAHERITLAA